MPATPAPPAPSEHRRRFLYGLAAAALLAAGVASVLLGGARQEVAREREDRAAVVTLGALVDVVERLGGAPAAAPAAETPPAAAPEAGAASSTGMSIEQELAAAAAPAATAPAASDDALRRAVASFAAAHPGLAVVRVIDLTDRRLLASTATADKGDQAAPRALRLPEKPFFDLGNLLRSAVAANRAGNEGVREAELSVVRRPDGSLELAAPVERGGEVQGVVEVETLPGRTQRGADWGAFFLAWLAPVVLFALLSGLLPAKRGVFAAAATILLLAALLGYQRFARQSLAAARSAESQAVAGRIAEETKRAEALLPAPVTPPLNPTAWDADLFRRPRGAIDAAGQVSAAQIERAAQADARRVTRALTVLFLLALLLLAFVGFGGAAAWGANLVEYRT
ncbi:MAG TPA: hypothetical protein VMM92_05285, partial [Thermoanaerobaculia bacterium]|nr:hypothetical protein [Thermoanaerobaculia bacterium]